ACYQLPAGWSLATAVGWSDHPASASTRHASPMMLGCSCDRRLQESPAPPQRRTELIDSQHQQRNDAEIRQHLRIELQLLSVVNGFTASPRADYTHDGGRPHIPLQPEERVSGDG